MGAIIGRRFVWELGDGTSHTRDSQHTSSGFVHNDLGNPALWSTKRVKPRNGETRECVARRRTYGIDLDEASHVTDHSPLACRYLEQLFLLFVWLALRAILTNTVPLEITLG